MIQIKKVQGTALQATPQVATVVAEKPVVWLWRCTATKGGVIHQITTQSFAPMALIIENRRRQGWKINGRIKVRRQQ